MTIAHDGPHKMGMAHTKVAPDRGSGIIADRRIKATKISASIGGFLNNENRLYKN